jgi:AcrR family transcriptional regulator
MSDPKPEAVRRACTDRARTGEPVTFTAIAEAAGISRATLYRRRDLRDIVERHRDPLEAAPTLTGLATQIDQLRISLEAVAERVRRHEEQLRRLNKETG